MLRHALILALALPFVVLSDDVAAEASSDSLRAQFYTSVAVRSPNQKIRLEIETLTDQTGATRDTTVETRNPFDYELAVGVSGTDGSWTFVMNYEFERQNGLHYINQEYSLSHDWKRFKIGGRFRDIEEDNLYYLNLYLEAKVMGWVGIGVERAYSEAWLDQGATLARFSLVKNRFSLRKLTFRATATHSINPTQSRSLGRIQVQNFQFGRIAVVPFYQIERLSRKNQPPVRSFRGKIKVTISL